MFTKLLPKYKGLILKVLRNKDIKTGSTIIQRRWMKNLIMVKLFPQKSFFYKPNDNEEDLKRKTQKIEYKIYPEAIINLF